MVEKQARFVRGVVANAFRRLALVAVLAEIDRLLRDPARAALRKSEVVEARSDMMQKKRGKEVERGVYSIMVRRAKENNNQKKRKKKSTFF